MEKFHYVRVLLYAYPKLEALGRAIQESVERKAALSFRSRRDAYALAEQIAVDVIAVKKLQLLKAAMDDALKECGEEELYLLEYKYFRRKAELTGRFAGKRFYGSVRSYFRTQQALFVKIKALLFRRGYTAAKYEEEFGSFLPFRKLYEKLEKCNGKPKSAKRQRLACRSPQNSSAGAGREDFLPRRMSATTRTAAIPAAQTRTICTGVGEGSSSAGG